MVSDKIIKELEKIRIRLTEIYQKDLKNPYNVSADIILRDEIENKIKTNKLVYTTK